MMSAVLIMYMHLGHGVSVISVVDMIGVDDDAIAVIVGVLVVAAINFFGSVLGKVQLLEQE